MTNVKKLTKIKDGKVIAGICSGLANYFEVDPTIIRILFVLLAIFGGSGVIIYLILWIFVPNENQNPNASQEEIFKENLNELQESMDTITHKIERVDKKYLPGIILIFLGILVLLSNIGILRASYILPILFIALGVYLIFK